MLDCLTEKGRIYIARQREIADVCAERWNCDVVHTPDTEGAPLDALFCRNCTILAGAEIKARNLTRAALMEWRTYLITLDKVIEARRVAQSLYVPLVLLVGLYTEDRLTDVCMWRVTTANGKWVTGFGSAWSITQATCNGGEAERVNAFFPMNQARWVDVHTAPTPDLPAPLTASDIFG